MPVGPGAALADLDLEDRAETARRLRISVGVEVVFLVAVLAVTALLVNAAPGAQHRRTRRSRPRSRATACSSKCSIVPARTGPNEMHITVLKPDGVVANVLSVDAELSNPAKDIAPIKVTLIRLGPGHYTTNNLTIPVLREVAGRA